MENSKKETPIDWLLNQLEIQGFINLKQMAYEDVKFAKALINKAKAMDKEQKKDAWYDCFHNGQNCLEKNDPAEEYYKEIYNN